MKHDILKYRRCVANCICGKICKVLKATNKIIKIKTKQIKRNIDSIHTTKPNKSNGFSGFTPSFIKVHFTKGSERKLSNGELSTWQVNRNLIVHVIAFRTNNHHLVTILESVQIYQDCCNENYLTIYIIVCLWGKR